jgi:hypothetical protein
MKYVFRVGVQVEPMIGTQLPDDCAGAYVNVYVGSNCIRSAIDLCEEQLLVDCYKPIYTYEAYELELEDIDYDGEEAEGYPNNKELEGILQNGGLRYGPFNCFPPEENQLQ